LQVSHVVLDEWGVGGELLVVGANAVAVSVWEGEETPLQCGGRRRARCPEVGVQG
jgi:hypothetical protein